MPAETDRIDRAGDAVGRLVGGDVEPGKGHFDVLPHGEPGEEPEILKDERDPWVQPIEGLAVGQHIPLRRLDQSDHDADERALAAAAGTEDGQDLVGRNVERNVLQDDAVALVESDPDVADCGDRIVFRHRFVSPRSEIPSVPSSACDRISAKLRFASL